MDKPCAHPETLQTVSEPAASPSAKIAFRLTQSWPRRPSSRGDRRGRLEERCRHFLWLCASDESLLNSGDSPMSSCTSRRLAAKNRRSEDPKGTGRTSRNVPWKLSRQRRLADPARPLAGTQAAGRRPTAADGRRASEAMILKHKHSRTQRVLVFGIHCLARPRDARSCSPQRDDLFFGSSILRIFDVAVSACSSTVAAVDFRLELEPARDVLR